MTNYYKFNNKWTKLNPKTYKAKYRKPYDQQLMKSIMKERQ